MRSFEELLSLVQECCKHGDAIADETMNPRGIKVHPSDLKQACVRLHEDPSVYFDMLSCVTGIDNGVEAGTLDVVYNLYSIPFNHHLALKVTLSRADAEVDSVQDVWKTANWLERETFDMFGLKFKGHPDLRRILLPADWDGYPLRKDYKQQEYYRGVKVDV